MSLLRPRDGFWEWCSCCQLVLLSWREQMSICVHLCPSVEVLSSPGEGLAGGDGSGWFGSGEEVARGWHNPFLQAVAPQRLLPRLAGVIRAHWPG